MINNYKLKSVPIDPFFFSIMYTYYIYIKEEENKISVKKKVKIFIHLNLLYKVLGMKEEITDCFPEYFKANDNLIVNEKPVHEKYNPIILFKIILLITIILYLFIIIIERKWKCLLFLIIFCFIYLIVFPIQIIPWPIHSFFSFCSSESKENNVFDLYYIIVTAFKGFKFINYIMSFLFFFAIIILTFLSFLISNRNKGFSDIDKTFNKSGQFVPRTSFNKVQNNKNNFKSAMCLTKYYNLNLIQIASLAQVVYYKDTEKIKYYLKNSVFNGHDNIKISNIEILSNDDDDAILMMTDLDIKNQKGLRVFSVRGTSNLKDALLDIEIFAPSIMLTLIRKFKIGIIETYFSKKLSQYLTYTIRYFKDYTLTYHYITQLSKLYEKNINTDRNIIFTGHSLGGGLAKYLGVKYNKQTISFSGPGVTPLEAEFSKSKDFNKYIKTYFVDVIPDIDIIPRIETTSGTIYRIICEESIMNFAKCHSIDRTFCMMGIMCDFEEEYTGNICEGIFSQKELKKMRDAVSGQ